ncbi:flocculation protein FLO11-like [Rhinatrema bivittatum]|uniref:flocculation protein FLO11-like n=1 Tax=Rhinatrema bivittatum TaxID=194408 RepID=UPI0011272AD2|nr:flocculation protein FLO11-like [Rhinatrema bivittatum]
MKLVLLGILLLICVLGGARSQSSTCQKPQTYAKDCSQCDQFNAKCTAFPGYVTCGCNPGYYGDGITCTALVSCSSVGCCPSGYAWDSQQKCCVDVDECASSDPSINQCVPSSSCKNSIGLYICKNQNVLCNGNNCSGGQDCLRVSGVDKCGDPCNNYNVLDGLSRLSNISSSGVFSSDANLVGWYRFNGSADGLGVRIQEGCIGPLRCGSAQPYTLNGSHPTLADGIVTRSLFSNRASGCVPSSSVSIKQCPGGFFVYKFSGFSTFDVCCTNPDLNFLNITSPSGTTASSTFRPASVLPSNSTLPSAPPPSRSASPSNSTLPSAPPPSRSASPSNSTLPSAPPPSRSASPSNSTLPSAPPPSRSASPSNSTLSSAPPSNSTLPSAPPPSRSAPLSNSTLPSAPPPSRSASPSNSTLSSAFSASNAALPSNSTLPSVPPPSRSAPPSNSTLPSAPPPSRSAPPSNSTLSSAFSASNAALPSNSTLPSVPPPSRSAPPSNSTLPSAPPSNSTLSSAFSASNSALPSNSTPSSAPLSMTVTIMNTTITTIKMTNTSNACITTVTNETTTTITTLATITAKNTTVQNSSMITFISTTTIIQANSQMTSTNTTVPKVTNNSTTISYPIGQGPQFPAQSMPLTTNTGTVSNTQATLTGIITTITITTTSNQITVSGSNP